VTQKPSFEQYLLMAAGELGFENDPISAERSYKFNLRSAHQSVTSGDVMSGVLAALKEMGQQYAGGNPNLLFFDPTDRITDLPLLQKSFTSTIEKVYRTNVLYNRSYPAASPAGSSRLHTFMKM
jgi:hypothetical protein